MRSKILAGTTSLMAPIFVTNSSIGGGLGSLVFNSSGLVGEYRRAGSSSWTSISLTTATLGTFASGGWIADGGLTGAYEVGIPNAALASGQPWAAVRFYGATNMTPVLIYFELDAVNYQDAVHFGLSSLPNTAVTTNASLLTSGTGTDQISVSAGKVLLQATQSGVTIPTVTAVGTLTTYTGNTPQTGDSFVRLGAPAGASVSADVASVKSSVGAVTGNVSGNVAGSVGSVVGPVGSVTTPVDIDLTGTLSAARALDTIADTSLTLNDAFHCAVAAAAGKQTIVGTAYTIETPSTGTVLRTFALDSATKPTSRT